MDWQILANAFNHAVELATKRASQMFNENIPLNYNPAFQPMFKVVRINDTHAEVAVAWTTHDEQTASCIFHVPSCDFWTPQSESEKIKYIRVDGSLITGHECIVPDHYLTTFVIETRSNFPLHPEPFRNLIQKNYEVTKVRRVEEVCITRNKK